VSFHVHGLIIEFPPKGVKRVLDLVSSNIGFSDSGDVGFPERVELVGFQFDVGQNVSNGIELESGEFKSIGFSTDDLAVNPFKFLSTGNEFIESDSELAFCRPESVGLDLADEVDSIPPSFSWRKCDGFGVITVIVPSFRRSEFHGLGGVEV